MNATPSGCEADVWRVTDAECSSLAFPYESDQRDEVSCQRVGGDLRVAYVDPRVPWLDDADGRRAVGKHEAGAMEGSDCQEATDKLGQSDTRVSCHHRPSGAAPASSSLALALARPRQWPSAWRAC